MTVIEVIVLLLQVDGSNKRLDYCLVIEIITITK